MVLRRFPRNPQITARPMTNSPVNLDDFRIFEYNRWQQCVDQYDYSFGSLTCQTIDSLLTAVNAIEKTRILDIATGPGYVAHSARERGCDVVALDFSDAMISRAQIKHSGTLFVKGDAENLPFNQNEFNAATMNFGLLHLAEPDKALNEAFRVIQNHGRFGFTVWTKPHESVGFEILSKSINQYGDLNVSLPNGPPFFHYSDPDTCSLALKRAGFSKIEINIILMTWELRDHNEFFDAFYKGSARNGGLLCKQTPKALTKIRDNIKEEVSIYTIENRLYLPMSAILATGQKG